MKKIKNYIKSSIIFIIITAGIFYSANFDYTWRDKKIKSLPKNWKIYTERKGGRLLSLSPWNFFVPSTEFIELCDTTELIIINDTLIGIISLIIEKEGFQIKSKETIEICDCKNDKRKASFNSIEELSKTKIEDYYGLEFKIQEEKFIDFCQKRFFCMGAFGENIEITSEIISGKYEIINKDSFYVREVRAKSPYTTTEQDENIIKEGIRPYFLNDYFANKFFISQKNIYKNAKYKKTILEMGGPLDIYSIKIPFDGNEIIELEFYFSRHFKYNKNKEDKIIIL